MGSTWVLAALDGSPVGPMNLATWWRHQMETISALLAICVGNSPVPGEFLAQRPVTRSFDVFFDQRLNKRLSKQPRCWWFETLSRPLWRHRNAQGGYAAGTWYTQVSHRPRSVLNHWKLRVCSKAWAWGTIQHIIVRSTLKSHSQGILGIKYTPWNYKFCFDIMSI